MKTLYTAMSCLLLSTLAIAQPATMLGPDLEPRTVTVVSLSSEMFQLQASNGEAITLNHPQLLRLSIASGAVPSASPDHARLTLRDGQVVVGKIVPSNDEEAVRLKIDEDRVVQVLLDEMLSLAVQAKATPPAAEEDDALLLATGEVLLGFVETFSKDTVGFVVGDADDAIQIPIDRIKALSIANEPRPAEVKPGTLRATTVDGSVLLIEEPTLKRSEEGEASLVGVSTLPILSSRRADEGVSTAASAKLALPMDRINTIEPVSTKLSLSPLAAAPIDVLEGGEVFGVEMPPRVGTDGSIHLHAPVTVGFDLPDGVSRLAFSVAMDLDESIPESRRALAGCELVVYDGEKTVAKHTLTPDGPTKRVNIPLTDGLRIALDPGVNGPVLDRVLLTRAELLVSD